MKSLVFDAIKRTNSTATDQEIGQQAVGFLAGIAYAQLDPSAALSLHLKMMREWALDPQNPADYGPSAMARIMIRVLAEEIGPA